MEKISIELSIINIVLFLGSRPHHRPDQHSADGIALPVHVHLDVPALLQRPHVHLDHDRLRPHIPDAFGTARYQPRTDDVLRRCRVRHTGRGRRIDRWSVRKQLRRSELLLVVLLPLFRLGNDWPGNWMRDHSHRHNVVQLEDRLQSQKRIRH